MAENKLLQYLKDSGFEDLIVPILPEEMLELFPLPEIKEAYNKVLQGDKPVPPAGGEIPELKSIKQFQKLEDAVKQAQQASGLDDDQMKEAFKGLLEQVMGVEGASDNQNENLTFSKYKNNSILKRASGFSWVKDYFLSALPIGSELVSLVYILNVALDEESIKSFTDSLNPKKQTKTSKILQKFKADDILGDIGFIFEMLGIGTEDFYFDVSELDRVMNYLAMTILGLVFLHLVYFYIELFSFDDIAVLLANTESQIEDIKMALMTELMSSVFTSLLISLVATPAAALAIQLKRVYKVKKISSKIGKLIGLRSKMYKILESKPARLLLKISSRQAYDDVNDNLSILDSKHHVNKIRAKLGIKVFKKKSDFNNLLIIKLAKFLEKNNLKEELRILKEEIL